MHPRAALRSTNHPLAALTASRRGVPLTGVTTPHTFTNTLTPEYLARRDALKASFPAAHSFLCALEALTERGRFHLGTAQNVHLYDGESFLMYVRIERNGAGRPMLAVSPEPHQGKIKDGTQTLHAPAFVKQVVRHVSDLRGFHRWAERPGAELTLMADTPSEFFDAVLADLQRR